MNIIYTYYGRNHRTIKNQTCILITVFETVYIGKCVAQIIILLNFFKAENLRFLWNDNCKKGQILKCLRSKLVGLLFFYFLRVVIEIYRELKTIK